MLCGLVVVVVVVVVVILFAKGPVQQPGNDGKVASLIVCR
jgi:hypothetical protein